MIFWYHSSNVNFKAIKTLFNTKTNKCTTIRLTVDQFCTLEKITS